MNKKNTRPVRRQDIQFRRSLFQLTALFFFIVISGVVTNLVLDHFPVKDRLIEKVQLPEPYQLNLDQVNFAFRSGWLPVFGLSINRLDIIDKSCSSRTLGAQGVLVRIRPLALIRGQLKVGRVGVDFLEVNEPKDCQDSALPDKDPVEVESIDTPHLSVLKKVTKKVLPAQSIQAVFDHSQALLKNAPIESLDFQKIQFNYLQSFNRRLSVLASLQANIKGQIHSRLKVNKVLINGQDISFGKAELKSQLDQKRLDVELKSSVREGDVLAQLSISNSANYPSEMKMELKRVPLSAVLKSTVGETEVSYLWAECRLQLQAHWPNLMQQDLQFSDCRVDGPYGQIVVKKIEASLSKIHSFEIEVDKVDLEKVIENKRDVYFSGIFSNFGILSGQWIYKESQWRAQGLLEGAEFIFSNNTLRDIQKAHKIPFSVLADKGSWQARIEGTDLEDGVVDGEVVVRYNQQKKSLSGRVAIHKLILNPRVYKLMIQSQPAELRLYGKFKMQDRQLQSWSAILAAQELQSEYYELHQLKMKAEGFKEDPTKIKLTAVDGTLTSQGPLLQWLSPTFLEKSWPENRIEFNELSTRLQVERDRTVRWSRGYVRLKDGWQFSSEGLRRPDKKVQAWLQWDRPDHQYLKWTYQGTFFKGKWIPETQWVRQWLLDHTAYLKDNPSIQYDEIKTGTLQNENQTKKVTGQLESKSVDNEDKETGKSR